MLRVDHITVRRGSKISLQDVSFTLSRQRSLAVVGESGAGKSTLINSILGLVPFTSGTIHWDGEHVRQCRPALVMQEPRSAFNPRLSLGHSVMEPLKAEYKKLDRNRFGRLCKRLEIPKDLLDRRMSEVSIGQAQRVGILRALIAGAPLILFDEPLSALDAVTQKHTARLIADLQEQEGFAALIVTHDLGYAAAFSDNIAVLRAGRLEELTPTATFIERPQSEYGCSLRDAAYALGALERVA